MKINFRARYLNYNDIMNNIVKLNNINIHMFHFFKNNQLLYTKKMVYNYNYYRISNSVLNLLYKEKKYKISYIHYIILLTDIYVKENQKLIYMNVYKDNQFCNFIISSYYESLSRNYIHYDKQIYYHCPPRWISNFYYYNHYITNQEINNVCDQLAIYGKSIKLLYML